MSLFCYSPAPSAIFKVKITISVGGGRANGANHSKGWKHIHSKTLPAPLRAIFFDLSGYTDISKVSASFCSKERIPNISILAGMQVSPTKFLILVCIHCGFHPAIVNHLPLIAFSTRNLIYQYKPAITNFSLLWKIILRHQTNSTLSLVPIKQQQAMKTLTVFKFLLK